MRYLLILSLFFGAPAFAEEAAPPPANNSASQPQDPAGNAGAPMMTGPKTDESGVSVNQGSLHNKFLITQIQAEQGEPQAQLRLARLFIEGKGTRQNDRKANYWLDKAARHGLRDAQVMLADRYYAGIGTPRPYLAHALKWYIRAGEQGDAHAEAMAGKMYYHGQGTDRDYHEAFKWLYQSAQHRDAESQHLVGVMYRFGHGMEKNYLYAYIWLHVAYVSTQDPAEKENIRKQRDRVGKLMEESELLGAKLLAPEYADMYAYKNH
jgi:TPR repeat protein